MHAIKTSDESTLSINNLTTVIPIDRPSPVNKSPLRMTTPNLESPTSKIKIQQENKLFTPRPPSPFAVSEGINGSVSNDKVRKRLNGVEGNGFIDSERLRAGYEGGNSIGLTTHSSSSSFLEGGSNECISY